MGSFSIRRPFNEQISEERASRPTSIALGIVRADVASALALGRSHRCFGEEQRDERSFTFTSQAGNVTSEDQFDKPLSPPQTW